MSTTLTCVNSPAMRNCVAIHIEAEAVRKVAFMSPLEDSIIDMVSSLLTVHGSLPGGNVPASATALLHETCRLPAANTPPVVMEL